MLKYGGKKISASWVFSKWIKSNERRKREWEERKSVLTIVSTYTYTWTNCPRTACMHWTICSFSVLHYMRFVCFFSWAWLIGCAQGIPQSNKNQYRICLELYGQIDHKKWAAVKVSFIDLHSRITSSRLNVLSFNFFWLWVTMVMCNGRELPFSASVLAQPLIPKQFTLLY